MAMLGLIKKTIGRTYHPLNRVELSRENLLSNFNYLSSLNKNTAIAPVLKSNAYGHGLIQIAKMLDNLNCPFFCVDSIYEAYELYKAKIQTPILIMGYIDPENLKVKKLPFSYAVYDLRLLEVLNVYQSGAGVHIKVDTGMHRLGVTVEELPAFLKRLRKYKNIKVEGLMSHLAFSQNPKNSQNIEQLKQFRKTLKLFKSYGFRPKWRHLASSSGLLNLDFGKGIVNIARVGMALYGIDPSKENPNLKPVLSLKTKLVQIKRLKIGEKVGYEGTFESSEPMFIGVIPLGYFDGIDRRLSNKGYVLVDGVKCKIAGIVSMNITTIDISRVRGPFIGQEVLVYSNNLSNPNTIEKTAKECQAIPYELLVHITPSMRREII